MKMAKSAIISFSIAFRNPPWRLGFVKFELKTSIEMVKSKDIKHSHLFFLVIKRVINLSSCNE